MLTLLVGSYNKPGVSGLTGYSFDQITGNVHPLDGFDVHVNNPSFFTFEKKDNLLFCVSEMNVNDSSVFRLKCDKNFLSFDPIDIQQLGLTGSPCYVSACKNYVVTANYGGGNVDFITLDKDNNLSNRITIYQGKATGSDEKRQNAPHIHCVVISPNEKRLYICDFSDDSIVYVDIEKIVSRDNVTYRHRVGGLIRLPAGTGPRHLVFDAKSLHAYVLGELSGDVTVFDVSEQKDLIPKQTINADRVHERASADIHLSPDGKFLYASNRRQNDGIAIFKVKADDGTLETVGYQTTGRHPRSFVITPNGLFVLVACRDDNAVEVYKRDTQTGLLELIDKIKDVNNPVCVKFAPSQT